MATAERSTTTTTTTTDVPHTTTVARPTASQQARRARILAAALDLLAVREYERIQMRDVTEAAGVALGTLYRYFPSKEQLFAHALLTWSETFEASIRRRGGASPRDRLSLTLRRAATAFERHPNCFGVITVLEVTTDPEARATFEAYGDRFRQVVTEALEGVEPDDVEVVIALALPLLAAELRSWATGRASMRAVHDHLDRGVDLIFREPRRAPGR